MPNKLFGSRFRCSCAFLCLGINSSILGAILFISCNGNRENVVDAKNVVVWDSLIVDGTVADAYTPSYDTTFVINPASYKFTVVDAFDTIPKKKSKKIYEQNVDLPLKEDNPLHYSDIDVIVLDSNGLILDYDTVKVIMLACDTTSFGNFTHAIAAFNDHGKEYDVAKTKNHIPYVYWLFGYKVYQNGQYKIDGEVPCEYLDENKKPLSKNIIVWLSK